MLWWCVQNTLIAGALAGLVWLVCRGLRPSPAIRHALWLVVLIKLITPPLLVFTLPLPDPWKAYLAAQPAQGIERDSDGSASVYEDSLVPLTPGDTVPPDYFVAAGVFVEPQQLADTHSDPAG